MLRGVDRTPQMEKHLQAYMLNHYMDRQDITRLLKVDGNTPTFRTMRGRINLQTVKRMFKLGILPKDFTLTNNNK